MNETRTLAHFVANARFADLPPAVVRHTKHLLLDHLGVALFSSQTPWGKIAIRYAKEFAAVGQCTVYGQPWKTSAQHAALANGLCAHGYELDDSYEGGYCHPGAPTIPAGLAAAERDGKSGRDLLLGLVMGYELMGRVSRALGREGKKQHHPTGQVGVFGAAGAAGKVMGLDEALLTNALGIAGGMASGNMAFAEDPKGTMVKRLFGGWPSQSGVVAAWMAREGFTGPGTIIEGQFGFLRSITNAFDPSKITAELGEDWQVLRTVFKPYASCRAFHPLVEALRELRDQHAVTPANIAKLRIGTTDGVMKQQIVYEPESLMAAQYSMPFTAAMTFHRDLEDPASYDEGALSDPAVLALAKKVEGYYDPEIEAFPRYAARVTAELVGGNKVDVTTFDHKGTPIRPYTQDEIANRFRKVTASVLEPAAAQRIMQAVDRLDSDAPDAVETLCKALREAAPKLAM
jgi:2-methylcitrate dehydratase PrpD